MFGTEVEVKAGDLILAKDVAMINRDGVLCRADRIPTSKAPGYRKKRLFAMGEGRFEVRGGDIGGPRPAIDFPDEANILDDVRTLSVDFDTHGERYKEWRLVVQESSSNVYPDCPCDGRETTLDFLKLFERNGGKPTMWLKVWAQNKGISTTDRVYHELEVLCTAIERAGSYDQLNMPSLASFETLIRRVAVLMDAH